MNKQLLSFALIALFASFLISCGGYAPFSTPSYTSTKLIAKRSPLTNPTLYPESADYYLRTARTVSSPEQESYLLKAAGRLIQNNDYEQAESIFQEIENKVLPEDLQQEKILLQASLSLHKRQADRALQLLSISSSDRLTPSQKIYYYQLLSYAYQQIGDTVNSVQARIKLDPLLIDIDEKLQNERQIWQSLLNLDQATLHTLSLESSDAEVKGWYQIAALKKQNASIDVLKQWQTHNSKHPANQFINLSAQTSNAAIANEAAASHTVETTAPIVPTAPKFSSHSYNIALLLPSTGRYANASKSVKDGFLSAYQLGNNRNIAVQVYDTAQSNSLMAAYQRAIQEGAHAVVGPMAKPQVQQLAATASLPVPTLALNYASARNTSNLYEFGMSPTLEAMLAANKAIEDGRRRIVIIRPQGAWGNEVSQAFTQQWQQQGGVIVDQLIYSSKQDLNQNLKSFLRFSEYKVKAAKGRKKSVANRRQDMDSIFLLATPSMGRQIRPLLKFYYVGEIPVYSTSMIYSGKPSPQQDKDLDGIIFCDNPWVLSQRQTLPSDDARLYALGLDAFGIITQLDQARRSAQGEITTPTGSVVVQGGRFQRSLRWAQFRQGIPYLLD